jgi:hypothetical protein
MDQKLTWAEEKAIYAASIAACEAQAELERQEAVAAVRKALASYRWWGLSAVLNRLRMLVTRVKMRFGMRLWP